MRENLNFVLKQSFILSNVFAVINICCLATMKTEDYRPNYTRYISNFLVPEEVSRNFGPEIDLKDDAVGRSRYKRFYSVRSSIMRQKIVFKDVSRDPSRIGCL